MSKTKTSTGGTAVATTENPPFSTFSKAVHKRFTELSKNELYVVDVGDKLFEQYLAAFPEGTNPIFREKTEFDCNCCKQFVRRLGNVVGIGPDYKLRSVWDDLNVPFPYKEVADTLSAIVRAANIKHVFRTSEPKYGLDHNFDTKTQARYEHFHGEIATKHHVAKVPKKTKRSGQTEDSADTQRGIIDGKFQTFKRGLTEIQESHLADVLDLIDSNALYKGAEFKPLIAGFQRLLREYKKAGSTDTFVWARLDATGAGLRGIAVGTIFEDLAKGKDLDNAVKSYEVKVAPGNYKRPTAIITQGMMEKALETLTTLGLGESVWRRHATIEDVSINDVLWADNEAKSRMKDSLTQLLEASVTKPKFDAEKAVAMTADAFIKDILPKAKSLDLLLQNRHLGNFVSLTAPKDRSEPSRLFKWNNPFAWSYDGDVTDSVKMRVKAKGGNINAKLRVSLAWFNKDDLDLHVKLPYVLGTGREIYYGNKCGILDVDENAGTGRTRTPVENLAFNSNDLRDGVYEVFVHQYQRRETIDVGFSIEIEFAGQLREFSYPKAVSGDVACFKLTVRKGELVDVSTAAHLIGGSSSSEKWGVKTETLVPVAAVMNSPNHWGEEAVGAKHLIFALKGCKNPDPVRGIYNEFLRSDLEQHRKVFEVLASKTKCVYAEEQISGVGFTKARSDSVTVVVDGKRSYTLTF